MDILPLSSSSSNDNSSSCSSSTVDTFASRTSARDETDGSDKLKGVDRTTVVGVDASCSMEMEAATAPPLVEMPVKSLSQDHMQTLAEKCSHQKNPPFPVFSKPNSIKNSPASDANVSTVANDPSNSLDKTAAKAVESTAEPHDRSHRGRGTTCCRSREKRSIAVESTHHCIYCFGKP